MPKVRVPRKNVTPGEIVAVLGRRLGPGYQVEANGSRVIVRKSQPAYAGVRLGPGALYGAITRLVERGLIEPLGSDDRRRPYRITPPGSAALAEALAEMRRVTRAGLVRLGLDPA